MHFATGPTLQAVLGESREDGVKKALGEAEDGKVISGMRRSAQVLIYVNLKRALEGGCPFWRSENGVILSEGVGGLVPLEFVDVVVERKIGLGRIWEGGKVLKDLP